MFQELQHAVELVGDRAAPIRGELREPVDLAAQASTTLERPYVLVEVGACFERVQFDDGRVSLATTFAATGIAAGALLNDLLESSRRGLLEGAAVGIERRREPDVRHDVGKRTEVLGRERNHLRIRADGAQLHITPAATGRAHDHEPRVPGPCTSGVGRCARLGAGFDAGREHVARADRFERGRHLTLGCRRNERGALPAAGDERRDVAELADATMLGLAHLRCEPVHP